MITKPFPEEFSAGHLGRIIRLNGGTETIPHAFRFVRGACQAKNLGTPLTPMHALAALCEIDVLSYAKSHTLMPFYAYAFQSDLSGQPSQWRKAHFSRFGLSSISPYAVLCEDCIDEDRSFWGLSYWRREHQLPGARWCTRHGSVLRFVNGREAFLHSPANMLHQSKPHPVTGILDFANGNMQSYHAIMGLMLEQGAPSSLALMRNRLAAHAKNIGLTLSSYSTDNKLLSDQVVRRFPQDWLREVFPRAASKKPGEVSKVFDNVLRPVTNGVISAQALAAALVVMFDHPLRAVNYVQLPHPPVLRTQDVDSPGEVRARLAPIELSSIDGTAKAYSRRSIYANDGWKNLADAYIRYAGDVQAMASALHSTASKIRWRMANQRKHLFRALRLTKEYEAMCTFLQGKSIVEASQINGIPVASIEALLRLLHRKMTLDEPLPSPVS